MKPCVAWADKGEFPQPLLCRPHCGQGWYSLPCLQGQGTPAPAQSHGGVCMATGDQPGSAWGTAGSGTNRTPLFMGAYQDSTNCCASNPKGGRVLGQILLTDQAALMAHCKL